MAKDNHESLDPLVQIYDLLTLQELDFKIMSIDQNHGQSRGRGKVKRGGKKTKKQRQRKAKSHPPFKSGQEESANENSYKSKFHMLLTKFRSVSQQKQSVGLETDLNEKEESKNNITKVKRQKHKEKNIQSLYKRGSRANWDINHRSYVKGINGVKEYVHF